MAIKLAENEQLLKSWNYATKDKKQYNLTVTDKRVVSSEYEQENLTRREISMSTIKSVDGAIKQRKSVSPIILILIAGILTFIIGITLVFDSIEFISAIFIGIALIVVFILLVVLKKVPLIIIRDFSFQLVIETNVLVGSALYVGSEFNKGAKATTGLFASIKNIFRKKKVKITIDTVLAKEILDEIGSIVVESQSKLA